VEAWYVGHHTVFHGTALANPDLPRTLVYQADVVLRLQEDALPRSRFAASRPRTPASSPNSGEQYRCPRPRVCIAKAKIFPRASLQKCNSISKSEWLILVNCVENHRKIRKM
jgi:hypothetical protein